MLDRLEIDDPRWTSFVQHHTGATPFHHPAWSALLAQSYGFRPGVMALLDAPGGAVHAGVPMLEVDRHFGGNRWISLPFTDACAPLTSDAGAVFDLLNDLETARVDSGAVSVELRAGFTDGPEAATPRSAGVLQRARLAADAGDVRRRFRRSHVWKNIVAAEKRGVTVRAATEESDVDEVFYELQTRTRRRHGLPVQPRTYFSRLWRLIIEPGLGFALLAYLDGTPVAGAVFLHWNRRLVYKYSATHDLHRNSGGTHLILWRAIEWGCEHGCIELDMGRTDADNPGLREFKFAWGADEEPLTYTYLGAAPRAEGSGRAAALLGPIISRSPLVVSRALGRALYRYAA